MSQDPPQGRRRRTRTRTARRVLLAGTVAVVALVIAWGFVWSRTDPAPALQLQLGPDVSFRYFYYVAGEGKGRWEDSALDPETGRAIVSMLQGAKPWQSDVKPAWSVAWDWPPVRRVYPPVQFAPPDAQLEIRDRDTAAPVIILDLYREALVGTDAGRFYVPEDKRHELAAVLSPLRQQNR